MAAQSHWGADLLKRGLNYVGYRLGVFFVGNRHIYRVFNMSESLGGQPK
jgi:hypothetical protein